MPPFGSSAGTLSVPVCASAPNAVAVKRGDIGETQGYYAKAAYEEFGVDAVTLNPYMGRDTLEPFLKYADKGFYLLGVTSNKGAADIELQQTGNRQVYPARKRDSPTAVRVD